jgi:pimeloyl-ACP methyl ester carboxylesterase
MDKPQIRLLQLRGMNFRILYWPATGSVAPAKTALLSHGSGLVAASWWLVAPQLAAAGYSVYAMDRRGHGGSDCAATGADHGGNGYEFFDFAEDIVALAEALDLQTIYGIGHSAGSTDLLLAAALRPGLFERLFVIDPSLSHPAKAGAALSQQALDT